MNRSVCAVPLIIMVSCAIAWANDEKKPEAPAGGSEGTRAGEAKEFVPGIVFHWCPAGTFVMGEYSRKVDVELTKLQEKEISGTPAYMSPEPVCGNVQLDAAVTCFRWASSSTNY